MSSLQRNLHFFILIPCKVKNVNKQTYTETFSEFAVDIRRWQNNLTSHRDESGKPYSQTYLRCINNQLTAIFNYAVKYYGLKENPCHKAGSIGKKNADEMLFWTKDEFSQFIAALKERPASYSAFMTL